VSGDTQRARTPAETLPFDDDGALADDAWGFRDTQFQMLPNGHVVLTGTRYALSGIELPTLVPWVGDVMQVDFLRTPVDAGQYPPPVPASKAPEALRSALEAIVSPAHVTDLAAVRLRHGHGHTVEEIFALRSQGFARVPDLVVYPRSEADVLALVELAQREGCVLVPFGGGTNVTEALRCRADEVRPIVSVDMRRMNRILWIDRENMMVCVEAGAVGRHLTDALAAHGLTIGHEPDSFEFSTVGGWVATHASGMKKNRYGNIEDLLLDVRVVTTHGIVSRTPIVPRDSIGVDPRRWILGSEGRLGIVTQAVLKVRPLPEREEFDAIVFKSFPEGVAFLRALTRAGRIPASVRLVDNTQFQLSQTLKPAAEGMAAFKRRTEKWYVTGLLGFDPAQMVACTLVFEGDRDDVAAQRAIVKRLAKQHGGVHAGAENGKKGYQLTFGIAYLRDFVMKFGVLAESFETTVSWTDVERMIENVKARLQRDFPQMGLRGKPFVTARITQLYDSGVCVYFYLGVHRGEHTDPVQAFMTLERAAREEILASGGSLSHHHGVGNLRRAFLPQVLSPAAHGWSETVKRAIDPHAIFGALAS
jgi:alkyldihydroxyacetonephosphate synthase